MNRRISAVEAVDVDRPKGNPEGPAAARPGTRCDLELNHRR